MLQLKDIVFISRLAFSSNIFHIIHSFPSSFAFSLLDLIKSKDCKV